VIIRRFIRQLQERKIWRAVVAYPAAGFAFLEAVEFFVNNYGLNSKYLTVGVVLIVGALPIALIWNWCHGRPGPQAVGRLESWSYAFFAGVILIAIGYYWSTTPDDAPFSHEALDTVADTSIAVLPFATTDGSTELDYLCDGIAESLINRLSSATELRIISRLSAFRLRGKEEDPMAVGRRLKVGRMLSGQLDRHGDELIVHASLVDTKDGRELWGDRFVRPISDILALENEIATDIFEELRLELPAGALKNTGSVHSLAYRHYLQGRFLSHGSTADEIDVGLDHLREATRLEPSFAPAYAAIADALIVKAFFSTSPPAEIVGEARTAAQSAIALDPDLAEAHAALASIRMFFDFDWPQSETAFQTAIALGPTTSVPYYRYANLLTALGRSDEALAMAKHAIDFDPIALGALHADSLARLLSGDFDGAVVSTGNVIEVHPEWAWGYVKKGLAHALLNQKAEALMLAEKTEELTDGWGSAFLQGWLAWLYKVVGGQDDLERIRVRIENGIEAGQVEDPFGVAIAYLAIGDTPKALDWGERTIEERSPNSMFWAVGTASHLKLAPDDFREHPRFAELLQEIGLEPHDSS
jgi:TolB-like protein